MPNSGLTVYVIVFDAQIIKMPYQGLQTQKHRRWEVEGPLPRVAERFSGISTIIIVDFCSNFTLH